MWKGGEGVGGIGIFSEIFKKISVHFCKSKNHKVELKGRRIGTGVKEIEGSRRSTLFLLYKFWEFFFLMMNKKISKILKINMKDFEEKWGYLGKILWKSEENLQKIKCLEKLKKFWNWIEFWGVYYGRLM